MVLTVSSHSLQESSRTHSTFVRWASNGSASVQHSCNASESKERKMADLEVLLLKERLLALTLSSYSTTAGAEQAYHSTFVRWTFSRHFSATPNCSASEIKGRGMADLEVVLKNEHLLARHRSITCITALVAQTQPVNWFWSLNMNTQIEGAGGEAQCHGDVENEHPPSSDASRKQHLTHNWNCATDCDDTHGYVSIPRGKEASGGV
jgi:hypothetical protein